MTFLFRMLHQILPCRDLLARIFPRVETNTCRIWDSGESDTLFHSLATCPISRDSFNWMMNGLGKYSENLTPQKILLLDIEPSLMAVHLPHHQLSLSGLLQKCWGESLGTGKTRRNADFTRSKQNWKQRSTCWGEASMLTWRWSWTQWWTTNANVHVWTLWTNPISSQLVTSKKKLLY